MVFGTLSLRFVSSLTQQLAKVLNLLMPAAFEAADTKKFVTTLVKQKSILESEFHHLSDGKKPHLKIFSHFRVI